MLSYRLQIIRQRMYYRCMDWRRSGNESEMSRDEENNRKRDRVGWKRSLNTQLHPQFMYFIVFKNSMPKKNVGDGNDWEHQRFYSNSKTTSFGLSIHSQTLASWGMTYGEMSRCLEASFPHSVLTGGSVLGADSSVTPPPPSPPEPIPHRPLTQINLLHSGMMVVMECLHTSIRLCSFTRQLFK